jgi:hypothetical protein
LVSNGTSAWQLRFDMKTLPFYSYLMSKASETHEGKVVVLGLSGTNTDGWASEVVGSIRQIVTGLCTS